MAGSITGSIQSGGASTNSFTPTLPNSGARVNNNYVFLIVSTENNNTVTCTISLSGADSGNWTQASPVGTGVSGVNECGLWLYYRKIDGSEVAPTVTLQVAAGTQYTYSCLEAAGLATSGLVDATNTWAAINSSAANTNQVIPAETFDTRWILMAIGGRASSPTGTWTGPTQAINVTNAANCYQIVGTQDATASASYQPKIVLTGNTLSTAVAFVFNLFVASGIPTNLFFPLL